MDAIHECDADADHAGADGQYDHSHLCPIDRQYSCEWPADTQVAVNSDSDHDE